MLYNAMLIMLFMTLLKQPTKSINIILPAWPRVRVKAHEEDLQDRKKVMSALKMRKRINEKWNLDKNGGMVHAASNISWRQKEKRLMAATSTINKKYGVEYGDQQDKRPPVLATTVTTSTTLFNGRAINSNGKDPTAKTLTIKLMIMIMQRTTNRWDPMTFKKDTLYINQPQ